MSDNSHGAERRLRTLDAPIVVARSLPPRGVDHATIAPRPHVELPPEGVPFTDGSARGCRRRAGKPEALQVIPEAPAGPRDVRHAVCGDDVGVDTIVLSDAIGGRCV